MNKQKGGEKGVVVVDVKYMIAETIQFDDKRTRKGKKRCILSLFFMVMSYRLNDLCRI